MGWDNFSYALHDDISLIEETLDIYSNWAATAVEKLCEMGLDFIWFADDIAYKNGLMFSPDFYRDICIPRFRKVVQSCKKPCIYHSDGNYLEVIDDLLSMGIKGFHPIEPLALIFSNLKKNMAIEYV